MDHNQKRLDFNWKQSALWMGALIFGAVLGALNISCVNELLDFIAGIYTRLFKFAAVPTIALAVTTTLALLGAKKDTGKIFLHTIIWTVLTSVTAAAVGALLYKIFAPGNLSAELVQKGTGGVPQNLGISRFTSTCSVFLPMAISAVWLKSTTMCFLSPLKMS